MSPRFAGAFTLCFIPALDEQEARVKILAALEADRYELVGVEYCIRYSRRDWDDLEGKIKSGVVEARDTGDVVYGEFQCWPHDAPDAV